MDSFRRGFAFLKQSWQMALADRDLIKPSIYALVVGFVVSLLAAVPMGLAGFLLGETRPGQIILYGMGAVLIFVQYLVGYVFSAMTIYLIYGYLAEGDGRLERAFAIAKRDIFDILSLATASTGVALLRNFLSSGKQGKRGGRVAAGLIDTIWTEATYLVLPIMVIEDVGLREGLRRASYIVRNNLLLIGLSTVGVKAVTGLIGFLLGATGVALGFGAGLGIVSVTSGTLAGWISGVALAVLIAAPFILAATVIGSYTATAYHTCLYLWARDVERAQVSGEPFQVVQAPAPLAAVLEGERAPVTSAGF